MGQRRPTHIHCTGRQAAAQYAGLPPYYVQEEALRLANNVTRLTLVNTDGMAAHLRVVELADSPVWRGLTK